MRATGRAPPGRAGKGAWHEGAAIAPSRELGMNDTTKETKNTVLRARGVAAAVGLLVVLLTACSGSSLGEVDRVFLSAAGNWDRDRDGAVTCLEWKQYAGELFDSADANRDGFVISGGAGVLVLESLSHAEARGAPVYAELVGYGATSDGHDMVQPSGDGAARCMAQALQSVDGPIDYLNAHGTSTPVGDIAELGAIRQVFGDQMPRIASTKSLTGHALGAAGVNEAVYALLMLREDFISASANIQELDSMAEGYPIVRELQVDAGLNQVMSNSFGFGGTNCTLVFRRFTG